MSVKDKMIDLAIGCAIISVIVTAGIGFFYLVSIIVQ